VCRFYGTQCIINVHGFLAVVEIPSSEKSAKSETSIFGLRFLRFFKCHFKQLKKSRYFGFAINVKNVFSNCAMHRWENRCTLTIGPPRCFLCVVDITVLLALSVYQLIVNDSLPVTSQSVPVFGQSQWRSQRFVMEGVLAPTLPFPLYPLPSPFAFCSLPFPYK